MIINENSNQFCSILQFGTFKFAVFKNKLGIILDSFKFRKFQTCNMIAMAKDLKSQYRGYLISHQCCILAFFKLSLSHP